MQGIGPADPVTGESATLFLVTIPQGVTTDPEVTAEHSISWAGIGAWSGMVVRSDPGQAAHLAGLRPAHRGPRAHLLLPAASRLGARSRTTRIALAFLADRYVDQEREFGQLRDEVERRTTGQAPS